MNREDIRISFFVCDDDDDDDYCVYKVQFWSLLKNNYTNLKLREKQDAKKFIFSFIFFTKKKYSGSLN